MPGKLGPLELGVIVVIALLIFGPSKLSGVGRGLGEGIRNFRNAMRGDETPTNPEQKK